MTSSIPAPDAPLEQQTAALRDGAGVRPLDEGVIAVRGPDRASWLAAMVTNDVKALPVGGSRYTAIVHVKGKILADAWVCVREDELLVVVPRVTVDALLPHFDAHVIMEDVEIVRLEASGVIAVQGPAATRVLPPDAVDVFASDRLGRGGVLCLLDKGLPPALVSALADGRALSVSAEAWDVVRLEQGVPSFGVDFGTDHYVQEADITSRAVSFNKGCYLGQEVVCRLEMRGHVRRQLVPLVLDGEPPPAGTAVDGLGEITSSAFSPTLGRSVALAMIKWDAARAGADVSVGGRTARIVTRPSS